MAPTTLPQPTAAPAITADPLTITNQQVIAAMMVAGWSDADIITGAAIANAESSRNAAAVSPPAFDASRGYGLWQIEYPTHADLFAALPDSGIQNGDWILPDQNAAMALKIKESQGWGAWTTYNTKAYLPFVPAVTLAKGKVDALIRASGASSNPSVREQVIKDILSPPNKEYVAAHDPGATSNYADWGVEVLGYRTAYLTGGAAAAGTQAIGGVGTAGAQGVLDVYKPFSSVLDFLNALGDPHTWVRVALVVVGGGLVFVGVSMVARKPAVQVASVAGKVMK